MAFKLDKPALDRALSVEDKIFTKFKDALISTGLHVKRGSDDPRANGEFGDILISGSPEEFPFVMIEVKSSSYPSSFSLSDYERRVSRAQYVVIEGPMGIWACLMSVARENLIPQDDYYIVRPPMSDWIRLTDVVDLIRKRFSIH